VRRMLQLGASEDGRLPAQRKAKRMAFEWGSGENQRRKRHQLRCRPMRKYWSQMYGVWALEPTYPIQRLSVFPFFSLL
jgi:hypothetical protein